ncbi:hypothetical protein SAMN03080615_03503 [Amphritea atlantica]|uniref:Uncharacterized protein n=1 Tax=Amphritea atlantica TaxID=355243 RepID=A0A1H9KHF9_9GAMM|nr:hypothetical protein [Amphritea atlantica]SEQ98562.1 hypothetical protein SAMN03080615_03503 [Amphritea atlantica]
MSKDKNSKKESKKKPLMTQKEKKTAKREKGESVGLLGEHRSH